MARINYDNRKLYYLLLYIFAFLTILDCNSVYHGMHFGSAIGGIWQIILVMFFVISLNHILSKYISPLLLVSLGIFLFNTIFLVINRTAYSFNVFHPIMLYIMDPIMLLTCFVSYYSKDTNIKFSFFDAFDNVVVILATISLVFWGISMLGIQPNMSITINWGNVHQVPGYFGIDFLSQGDVPFLGFSKVIRNTGIFSEAPMYSYVLCVSLLVEFFLKKTKLWNFKNIVLILTIITTTSTTGILIMIPAILLKEFLISNNINVKMFSILCIPIALILYHFIFTVKVGDVSNEFSSYNERRNDMYACFHAWEQHIWIGNGLENGNAVLENDINAYLDPNMTTSAGGSGFLMALAQGGIIYALIYIIPTLLFSIKSIGKFLFAMFTFILLLYTLVQESYICIVLLSYFWSIIVINTVPYSDSNLSENSNLNLIG